MYHHILIVIYHHRISKQTEEQAGSGARFRQILNIKVYVYYIIKYSQTKFSLNSWRERKKTELCRLTENTTLEYVKSGTATVRNESYLGHTSFGSFQGKKEDIISNNRRSLHYLQFVDDIAIFANNLMSKRNGWNTNKEKYKRSSSETAKPVTLIKYYEIRE